MTTQRGIFGALVATAVLAGAPSARSDGPAGTTFAPSAAKGRLGAWLVAGPFKAAPQRPLEAAPAGVDESRILPNLDAELGGARELTPGKRRPPARWRLLSAGANAELDLKQLDDAKGAELVAYAAAVLHVDKPGRYHLMLGVDDGVRVRVDGTWVYGRDEARPLRDDDDAVPMDLSAGDHEIVLKLHQRDGAWAMRARVTDSHLGPALGAFVRLPGTTPDDARALAQKLAHATLERRFDGAAGNGRYASRLVVRFPDGAPRDVPLGVRARAPDGFDVEAGAVAVTAAGVGELVVALPPLAPSPSPVGIEATVAGRAFTFTVAARPSTERAIVRATRALSGLTPGEAWLAAGSFDTATYLKDRLAGLLDRGDTDEAAQDDEARELDRVASSLERREDPFAGRTGPMRRALASPIDGAPTEFGLYVPPSFKPGTDRRFPLVVGLHGMNGFPLGMLRWMFGGDDPHHDQAWEERHVGPLPAFDAIVVTPNGHGNTMYREVGEEDVVAVMEWARKVYPVDDTRISITGPSMGGIGSAGIPLHRPHVFAAAAPLCGYHSYLIRREVSGRALKPWERLLLEERSNDHWADNGEHLPLWIVHGTRDLPEENSGVLIDRYEKLHYAVKHDHPDAGHNVWQETYEGMKGLSWLVGRKLDPSPAHVRFRTSRLRWNTSAWVTVDGIAESRWADVDARAHGRNKVDVQSSGALGLRIRRDDKLLDPHAAVTVTVDGRALAFDAEEPIALHKEGTSWTKGALSGGHPRLGRKRHGVSGPLRDVFHEPTLVVYAAGDEARANEQVARSLSHVRPGLQVAFPVMSDLEFFARAEPLGNDRALLLVGRGNRVLDALDTIEPSPLRIENGAVVVGGTRLTGRELGAAFIRPNPARPDRYVVVVAGADAPGTLRALSLPELVPDFVVWDASIAPSRGQMILGSGALRAGGYFREDWSLPAELADPASRAP